MMEKIIQLLHEGDYSCVIANDTEVRTFTRRGVADLYDLFYQDPEFMKGASIADKVIGKGAATLMVLGGITNVYADIISQSALAVLQNDKVTVVYAQLVPLIQNRDKSGRCPLETLCDSSDSVEKLLPIIDGFIAKIRGGNK